MILSLFCRRLFLHLFLHTPLRNKLLIMQNLIVQQTIPHIIDKDHLSVEVAIALELVLHKAASPVLPHLHRHHPFQYFRSLQAAMAMWYQGFMILRQESSLTRTIIGMQGHQLGVLCLLSMIIGVLLVGATLGPILVLMVLIRIITGEGVIRIVEVIQTLGMLMLTNRECLPGD